MIPQHPEAKEIHPSELRDLKELIKERKKKKNQPLPQTTP